MKQTLENSPVYLFVFFGLMLLGLMVLFGEFLFSDKMLFGSDTLAAGLHHRTMLVEHFKDHGEIPQWDPHEFGGMPYVDAFHGDIFYPLSVLKFFIPLYYSLGLNLVLHIFLAGVFMFLTSREFGLGKTASLFSAATYMYAGYLVSLVASGHDGNIYVASLFPLVMLFLHRGFETRPFLNFSLLGLILGIIILAPQPRLSYFTLWAIASYTIYKIVLLLRAKKKVLEIIKLPTLAAYAIVIALLLSAIQFYPGYIYTSKFSLRTQKQNSWTWATSWSLHEEDVLSQLIPEFSGFTSSISESNYYWGKNAFKDSTETVGVVPIFLALIGLFFSRRKDVYFFGGLALFAFIYALGATTPLFSLFYDFIPKVKSLRAPAMIMFLFSFSIALLGGMGIQTILNWRKSSEYKPSKRFYHLLAALPLLMFVLAVLFSFAGRKMISFWSSIFFKDAFTWETHQGITKFDIALLNLPSVQNGAWFGFFLVALTAIFMWLYLNRNGSPFLLSALILLPIIDGVRFNARFVSVVNPDDYLKSNNVTDFFLSRPGGYRVLNQGSDYPSTMLHQFGIETVEGYHGNQLRWYNELVKGRQSTRWTNPRFLNLVGARYLMQPANAPIHKDYYGPIPLQVEKTSRYLRIVRNDNAFERVYLVNSFEVLSNHDEMIQEVLEGQEDLREIVYLEVMPEIHIPKIAIGTDSAWIISRTIDSVVVGVQCTENRVLILTENFYDSWKAYVDGQPTNLLRAYNAFRAVVVPAGAKEVLFKYKSERYELGKAITTSTIFYLIIAIGMSFWLGRTKGHHAAHKTKPLTTQ